MKKQIIISFSALLIVGAGAFYVFGSGYVPFGEPTQEQLDAAISQSAESAAQQTVEVFAQSSAAQDKELEELRQQVEQLNDALAETEDTATTPPTSEMQVVQVSLPASAESKPIAVPASQTPSTAPPVVPAPAKQENAGTVFEGHTVTVTDKSTSAVLAGGIDWPITKLYFFSADSDYLGSISGAAYKAIMDKYKVIGEGGAWDAPGSNGEWEFWFAKQFNALRGLSESAGNTSVNSSSITQSVTPSSQNVDADAYAEKVIELTNAERKSNDLHLLQAESEMMELAQIRAQEIADKFSHVRPDGVRISELGYGENISKGRNTPADAVSAWMNSSGHKANILNEKYESIGVGCFVKDGTLYWVQLFSRGSYHDENSGNESPANGDRTNTTAYTLNASELNLTAGETYQLAVENAEDVRVDWRSSKLSDGILSVDSNGNITTYYRSGMSSAKATLTVTAKIYVLDKLVKTLNCKVTVTQ